MAMSSGRAWIRPSLRAGQAPALAGVVRASASSRPRPAHRGAADAHRPGCPHVKLTSRDSATTAWRANRSSRCLLTASPALTARHPARPGRSPGPPDPRAAHRRPIGATGTAEEQRRERRGRPGSARPGGAPGPRCCALPAHPGGPTGDRGCGAGVARRGEGRAGRRRLVDGDRVRAGLTTRLRCNSALAATDRLTLGSARTFRFSTSNPQSFVAQICKFLGQR